MGEGRNDVVELVTMEVTCMLNNPNKPFTHVVGGSGGGGRGRGTLTCRSRGIVNKQMKGSAYPL